MNSIYLKSNAISENKIKAIKDEFEEVVKTSLCENEFENTKASLVWIVRGGMNYFDQLASDFLGEGNAAGIPSMKADHFANNFYRLSNALDYLCQLQKVTMDNGNDWNVLKDLRTLIVHSGEQLTNIQSIELQDYKDAQLGRIIKSGVGIPDLLNLDNFDYRIEIWTDKHDNSGLRQENEVDYDIQKENFKNINIFLNADCVKKAIFSQVLIFINTIKGQTIRVKKIKKLPEAVKSIVTEAGDFDKLEVLIKNKVRGGYSIEDKKEFWDGFGLKRLWNYTSSNFLHPISSEVRTKVRIIISTKLKAFWNAYNDETIADNDLPSLDVREVFKDYTPNYDSKKYLEGDKLFINIDPSFNQKSEYGYVDVDYLLKFIIDTNKALGEDFSLELENDVHGVICDYFVKSVASKLQRKVITKN